MKEIEKDFNDNQIPDVLEVAYKGLDMDVKQRKQLLEENKFNHQQDVDEKKLKLEEKKLSKTPAN